MANLLAEFSKLDVTLKVAILSLCGVILAAIIGIINKYMELIFNRRKDTSSEKLRVLLVFTNDILKILQNSSILYYLLKLEKLAEYLISKNGIDNLERVASMSGDKLEESFIMTSLRNDIILAMNISLFRQTRAQEIVSSYLENLAKISPYVTLDVSLTDSIKSLMFKAIDNIRTIESALEEGIDKFIESVKEVPYDIDVKERRVLLMIEFTSIIKNFNPDLKVNDLQDELDKIMNLFEKERKHPKLFLHLYEIKYKLTKWAKSDKIKNQPI